ncbi:unnamed protein product [Oncorhynchus mykiss]|uniref:CST complex subunit STN1 n=1 Tax=Oncorhynchus mykiss TaxID=8022 RepID=A0A060YJZ6_ONCMY|nr:unnamed protein product [Oncorhynchus mykiss]
MIKMTGLYMLCTEPEAGPSSGPPTSFKQLRELLQKSLQILQDEGLVFRKVKCQDEVYHVTERDKDLLMAIRDILREDCRREKYAEKGCHILHILSSVRQRYSRNVSKAALELVLKALECNSDIISTSDTQCDVHIFLVISYIVATVGNTLKVYSS